MKIGSFVGKVFLDTTAAEQEYILNIVKKVLNGTFSNPDKYTISVETFDTTKSVTFKVTGFTNEELRDRNGNTYRPKYIRVTFRKQAGYDEAVTGRFTTWPDGYTPDYNIISYSASVDFFGDYRRYRTRNVEYNVGITQTNYSYGTELNDLEVEQGLINISNYYYRSSMNTGAPLR